MLKAGFRRSSYFTISLCTMTRVILATLLVCSFFLQTASANPASNRIVLAVPTQDWPPYIIAGQDRAAGIAIDVFRQISQTNGYDLLIQRCSKKRAFVLLAQGQVDAWLTAREWNENPEQYLWSDPIMVSEDVLVTRQDSSVVFTSIEDLFGKTIGTLKYYVYPQLEPYFASGAIKRMDARGDRAMLEMVHLRRTDAAIINRWVALWKMKKHADLNSADFTLSKQVVGSAEYCVMFSPDRNWEPFIAVFNAGLDKMKQTGRFDEIISKYR